MKRIKLNAVGTLALAATIAIAATESAAQEYAAPGPQRTAPSGAYQRPEAKVTASGVSTNAAGEAVAWRNIEFTPITGPARNQSPQPVLPPVQAAPTAQGFTARPVDKVVTKRRDGAGSRVTQPPYRHSLEGTQGVTGNLYFKESNGKRVYWTSNAESLNPLTSDRLKHRSIPTELLTPVTEPKIKP